MSKKLSVLALMGLAIAANAANAQEIDNNSGAAAEASKSWSTRTPKYQTANVFDAAGGPNPDRRLGASWLIRSKDSIRGRIMSYVPTAGDPYTLWAVVFNNPKACVDGCNDDDLLNPKVRASVYNATGAISASNGLGAGVVNLDFELNGGTLPRDLFVLLGDPKGLRRNRGFKAEVHLVIDQHPPIVPGTDSWIADLTTTNFPGMGAASNIAVSILVGCPDRSCPESVL